MHGQWHFNQGVTGTLTPYIPYSEWPPLMGPLWKFPTQNFLFKFNSKYTLYFIYWAYNIYLFICRLLWPKILATGHHHGSRVGATRLTHVSSQCWNWLIPSPIPPMATIDYQEKLDPKLEAPLKDEIKKPVSIDTDVKCNELTVSDTSTSQRIESSVTDPLCTFNPLHISCY